MKKNLSIILGAVFVLTLLVPQVFSQQGSKIGVINSQEVLEKSSEGKKVIARLQESDKKNQADLAKLDDEIRQLETRLNTQRLTLADEALMQMNSDLTKKRTDRTRLSEDAGRNIQELQYRLFNRIQSELIPIIEQLGKEKGFDMIFDLAKSGAVYFNPAVDITEDVIKRYDASKAVAPK